jgi:hypothetical protein
VSNIEGAGKMDEGDVITRLMKVAASEASASAISEVMPAHLLIALSRMSEDEASSGSDLHAAALRKEFDSFGIEPRKFRRRLRGLLSVRSEGKAPQSVRVSELTQSVLAVAEALARGSNDAPLPVHVLRAVLLCLADVHAQEPGTPRRRQDNAMDEIPHEL